MHLENPYRGLKLKFRESIMIWSAAGFGFLSGTFADKFGVKPIMLTGLLLFSLLYFIFVDVETLTDIYLIYLGFGPCLIFVGSLTNVILISKWFTKNRALGLGIMAAGSSIGSAFLTPFYAWQIELYGLEISHLLQCFYSFDHDCHSTFFTS
ncbi:MAG: hypothetical protein Ct9H90mP13_10080 [Pseudomonadota bacterium]|nr:MAG: hypothetical protein Ct9H90mP13_10080 [Pseudomonadota bacterium]